MQIIIILLVIIIIILCPAILGVAVVAVTTLLYLLMKLAIPLTIYTVVMLVLYFINKRTENKSTALQRTLIYLSSFFSLIIAVVFNLSEAYFLSYLILFSTIIFFINKCRHTEDVVTLKILVGFLCFLWGLSLGLELTLMNVTQIEREIPSVLTMIVLVAPFALFPLVFFEEYRRDIKNIIKENPIICILSVTIFVIGVLVGILLADSFPSILHFVNQNAYELRRERWD